MTHLFVKKGNDLIGSTASSIWRTLPSGTDGSCRRDLWTPPAVDRCFSQLNSEGLRWRWSLFFNFNLALMLIWTVKNVKIIASFLPQREQRVADQPAAFEVENPLLSAAPASTSQLIWRLRTARGHEGCCTETRFRRSIWKSSSVRSASNLTQTDKKHETNQVYSNKTCCAGKHTALNRLRETQQQVWAAGRRSQ